MFSIIIHILLQIHSLPPETSRSLTNALCSMVSILRAPSALDAVPLDPETSDLKSQGTCPCTNYSGEKQPDNNDRRSHSKQRRIRGRQQTRSIETMRSIQANVPVSLYSEAGNVSWLKVQFWSIPASSFSANCSSWPSAPPSRCSFLWSPAPPPGAQTCSRSHGPTAYLSPRLTARQSLG